VRVTSSILLLFYSLPAICWELGGEVGLEERYFHDDSSLVEWHGNASFSSKLDIYHSWNDQRDELSFTPYLRIDQNDSQRTKADIRELLWTHVNNNWETKVGIGRVFWGVTEGLHLVDIINQTDQVDQIDGEEKLGQPMINFSTVTSWGVFDIYILPTFRERTFSSSEGRPNGPIVVDPDATVYESSAKQSRTDFAFRWQLDVNDWQLALSHFSGTSREPELHLKADKQALSELINTGEWPSQYEPSLAAYYGVIDQTGLEVLNVYGDWLLKLEAVTRSGVGDRNYASATGFEYTQYDISESGVDIGWILEHFYDSRSTSNSGPFNDDWLFGGRVSFNDVDSSEILAGLILDPRTGEKVFSFESSKRVGSNISVSIEGRYYFDTGDTPSSKDLVLLGMQGKTTEKPLSLYSSESMLQATVKYFF
jgi:hypothetical protein